MQTTNKQLDVMIIGAGVAGLYQLHMLREQGLNVRAFDAAGGVGGTSRSYVSATSTIARLVLEPIPGGKIRFGILYLSVSFLRGTVQELELELEVSSPVRGRAMDELCC